MAIEPSETINNNGELRRFLQTLYSSSILCPLTALIARTSLLSMATITRHTLLEIADGSATDAELLLRALLASGCVRPSPGAPDAFNVDDAATESLLANTAGTDDVLVELAKVASAASSSRQVCTLPAADRRWLDRWYA